PIPVVIEKSRGSSKVLVERSSQIVVSVPTELPTPLPAAFPSDAAPPLRRRIVIEVRPTPTPTVPELELSAPPPPAETPEPPEPEPEETPEAVPTAGPRANAALAR
ncbi:MAG TPA: hypothetical protein VF958_10740, partial [Thermoanaerobaculia bacterium]